MTERRGNEAVEERIAAPRRCRRGLSSDRRAELQLHISEVSAKLHTELVEVRMRRRYIRLPPSFLPHLHACIPLSHRPAASSTPSCTSSSRRPTPWPSAPRCSSASPPWRRRRAPRPPAPIDSRPSLPHWRSSSRRPKATCAQGGRARYAAVASGCGRASRGGRERGAAGGGRPRFCEPRGAVGRGTWRSSISRRTL